MQTRRRTEITIEKEMSIRVTRESAGFCPFCGAATVTTEPLPKRERADADGVAPEERET